MSGLTYVYHGPEKIAGRYVSTIKELEGDNTFRCGHCNEPISKITTEDSIRWRDPKVWVALLFHPGHTELYANGKKEITNE